jgi:hypothetical protein
MFRNALKLFSAALLGLALVLPSYANKTEDMPRQTMSPAFPVARHPLILGDHSYIRANERMASLSDEEYRQFDNLLNQTKSEEERLYLVKAFASGHPVLNPDKIDLHDFAADIRGKSREWLRNSLHLTADTTGRGVMQQFHMSCGPTMVQAVQGDFDPIYAMLKNGKNGDVTRLHSRNSDLSEEQKRMLELRNPGYYGSGVAVHRMLPQGGTGRQVTDLLNGLYEVTGVVWTEKKLGGSYDARRALADIDGSLAKGLPVPLVIHNPSQRPSHYVVVIGVRTQNGERVYDIHDVGNGTTETRSAAQIASGNLRLAGYSHIRSVVLPKPVS